MVGDGDRLRASERRLEERGETLALQNRRLECLRDESELQAHRVERDLTDLCEWYHRSVGGPVFGEVLEEVLHRNRRDEVLFDDERTLLLAARRRVGDELEDVGELRRALLREGRAR